MHTLVSGKSARIIYIKLFFTCLFYSFLRVRNFLLKIRENDLKTEKDNLLQQQKAIEKLSKQYVL